MYYKLSQSILNAAKPNLDDADRLLETFSLSAENDFNLPKDPILDKLEPVLKNRPFSKTEFRIMREVNKGIDEQSPLFLDREFRSIKGTRHSPPSISLQILMLSPTPDITFSEGSKAIQPDNLSPSYLAYMMTKNTIGQVSAQMPISLSMDHISERYFQRTQDALESQKASLLESIKFALLFTRAFPEYMNNHETDLAPIIIPNKNGLFLGHAERCTKLDFIPLFDRGINSKGKYTREQGVALSAPPATSKAHLPETRIYLKTFVSLDMLFEDQKVVWERLMEFFNTQEHAQAADAIIRHYPFSYEKIGRDENDNILNTAKNLGQFLETQEWKNAVRKSTSHLPDVSYSYMIVQQLAKILEDEGFTVDDWDKPEAPSEP